MKRQIRERCAPAEHEGAVDEHRVENHDAGCADQSRLFGQDCKDKVGMCLRKVMQFLHAFTEAGSEPRAAADRNE